MVRSTAKCSGARQRSSNSSSMRVSSEHRRDDIDRLVISGRRSIGARIRGGAESIALAGAALILAAQFLALTHFHQRSPIRQFNAQTQLVADDGLCALCNLALHAPLSPAA